MPNNAIEDEKHYRALQRQGASKEKAARMYKCRLVSALRNH